jgi:tRNA C32,U32 (ribose-2'-O)-methylase TrmJ
MNEYLTTVFTGVIAVATVIYTVMTIRLWRATRSSVDVAKAAVLMNYLTTLAQESEKLKATQPQAAQLLQQVAMLLTEASMHRFLEDIDFSKEPRTRDFLNKLEGLLRAHGIDPEVLPWFRPITEKMKG